MNVIYQDIERSSYSLKIDNIIFYFSSLFNLNRFEKRYKDYTDLEERKIINKYHVNIDMNKYLLICLYKAIEKRGFLIEVDNKRIKENEYKVIANLLVSN